MRNFVAANNFNRIKMKVLHPLQSTAERPQKFTYPFCYEPHPLCVEAAKKVRRYVATHAALQEDAQHGKMFGVLVVAPNS